ncbi:MAG: T9SS type A sorting domain-containing protein [Bacteroidia bacterium]
MKYTLTLLSIILFSIVTNAQETKMPLGRNVLLNESNSKEIINVKETKSVGKLGALSIPFTEYFNNKYSSKPDNLKWEDSLINIENLNAIFNSKNTNNAIYNKGFGEADILTTQQINTTNAGGNAFVFVNFSTGIDWLTNDSLVLQVKGNSGVWNSLRSLNFNNIPVLNQDVYLNINFFDDLKSNLLQLRLVSYCNTDTAKNEVFKVHQFIVSYKNNLPFYESFRQFSATNLTPINTRWTGYSNQVSQAEYPDMFWGNAAIFNSITEIKDSSYFSNNGLYGNADTLMANPIDFTKANVNDNLILSFWVRGFKQTRANDSIYLETLDNQNRWQRIWASGRLDTNFRKINVSVNGGRLRHQNFTFRFINKGTYSKTDSLNFAVAAIKISAKRVLPLFEDFSNTSGYYPNSEIWLDKNVFINNNFPKRQPSLNVATFDGLNEFGNPYNKQPIKTTADILTCKGYDLSNNLLEDSIYFSFFYQYQLQGTTGQIQQTDSLILEFRSSPNDADSFAIVWERSAVTTLNYDTFKLVLFALPKQFLHDDFQFRFKNIGSLSGNVSQWHIDYIRLDAGRSRIDTTYDDLAISSTPTSLLKKYRSMPWKHFELNKATYTNDSIYFSVFNNSNRGLSVDYKRELISNEQSIVFTKNNSIGSVPFSFATQLNSISATNLTTTSTDLVKKFSNKVTVKDRSTGNDNVSTNDSITTTTTFSNYFAYDDGTAEAGYGIYLKNSASVALAYDLEKVDTIYGVQIFFNQSEYNVSTRKYDLTIWDYISPIRENATHDRIIYKIKDLSPVYTNTINGFTTIRFDSGIVVPKRFYIGWEQVGQFVLNVGLDENYTVGNKMATNPNMFFKTDGFWLPTEIPGALMIRPLLGQFVDVPTNIEDKISDAIEFNIYPNPTKNVLNIETNTTNNCQVILYDLMGKNLLQTTIQNQTNSIDLPELQTGIYLVQIIDEKTGNKTTKKLIIQ